MVRIGNKTIHFGDSTRQDFTMHKDPFRMKNYISRHKSRENWTKSGLATAGFWSRWLLWSLPSLKASAALIYKKFGVKVIICRTNKRPKRTIKNK